MFADSARQNGTVPFSRTVEELLLALFRFRRRLGLPLNRGQSFMWQLDSRRIGI